MPDDQDRIDDLEARFARMVRDASIHATITSTMLAKLDVMCAATRGLLVFAQDNEAMRLRVHVELERLYAGALQDNLNEAYQHALESELITVRASMAPAQPTADANAMH